MNSSNASPHRNWMQDEQPTGGKWIWITLLTLFIIAGLVLMGVLMRTPPTTRTYLASICIGEYPDNILPSPVYAGWPHSEFLDGFEQRGLESWLTLDPYLADSSPRSRNKFDEDLASLSGVLKGRGAKSRDTLVLYLRGHALVIDGEAHLLIGEFDRDQLLNSQEFRVPLAEIFAALRQLDVANVIVLADVCDLRTFPAAGVVANHVPQQIGRLLEEVNADASPAGARLWVITACASLQPAYASGLQQRSLFQSACEFACSSRSAANAEQLSLADFYENLLRYSDFASSGEQTPLLFCSGIGGHLLENSASANQAWIDAQEVHLAGRLPAKPASADSQADSAADSLAQSEEKDSLPATSPSPQADSADPQTTGVASTANVAKSIADTPSLRFWNLRDQLISGRGNRWSPVEFAVAELNRIEREAARLELQNWYKQQPSQSAFSSRADEFDRLQNLLDDPTVSSSRPSLRSAGLLGSWFNLQAKLASKNDPRIPWLQPEVFPDSEREQWLATRGDYSAYMHALQQIAMQLGLWEDIDLPRNQWNNLERLLSKLERVQPAMPQDAATYLEDHHKNNQLTRLMNPIREDLQTLREGRSEEIRQLASLDSKEWNWGHERVLQSLLADPSLSLESRVELERLRKNLESLRSTGIALELPAQRRPLSQLTPVNANCQTEDLQRLKSQYAATQKALALMGDQHNNRMSALDAATTAEQLNRWGAEWIEYWQAIVESNSPTQRWNRCCLAELLPLMSDPSELAVDPDDEIALLLPYSNDFSLVPSLPTAIRLDATAGGSASWKIPIRRRNGTSVNTCSVSLTAVDSSSTTNFADQLLVQLGRGNNQPWTIGEQRRVNTELDGSQEFLRLSLNWQADLKSLPDDLSISLDIRDELDESPGALESVARIRVLPPRRDIVELVIRPTSGNGQAVVRSELEDELGNLHSAMRVPAVGHRAKSVYQFFVRNRSDRTKSVVVQLFPVIAPPTLLTGNGKIDRQLASLTLDAMSAGELSPIFESAPIELPADDGLDDHPVLFLPSESSPPPILSGEFGFLCVINETPSGEPTRGQTQASYEWIECSAYSGPELLQLEFPELRGEFVVTVAPTKYWSDFQLEEMQVSGQLTDTLGRRIEHQGNAPLTLKPGMSPQIMRFRPSDLQQNQGEKFVLQLDAGDYPRVRSVASSLRGRIDWENVTKALAEFNRASLRCLQANGTPIQCEWIEDQSGSMELVVPNRIGASDLGIGDKVTVAKIAGALKADFPKKGLAASGLLALGDHLQRRLHSDRKLQPRLDLKGPNLIFTCRASDIDFELDTQAIAERLEGPQELRFSITGSDQTLDTLRLNFDQRPPEPAAILVGEGDRRLFLGESLLLSISPVDNVEIQSVWFAIDQGQRDQMKFDEADLQHIQAKSLGEAWEETLKADELKQQPLRPGMEYRIVCRTIDVAGNIQDHNIPGTFLWMGKERPQSIAGSAPEPSKKEEEPTTSWATIVVSAPGSSRFDGSKVQLSGLSAKRKFYAGNGKWKFTDLPPGTYEVTAKYTDARNAAYEGQATVSVPGNEVSLQLRQAKQ